MGAQEADRNGISCGSCEEVHFHTSKEHAQHFQFRRRGGYATFTGYGCSFERPCRV